MKLPGHNEKVLVREGETIRVAVYDEKNRVFKLSKGGICNAEKDVEWMKFPKDNKTENS